jgi:hypothetical protein
MRMFIAVVVCIVARVPRIGYLALGSITAPAFFVQKMREQGYAAGQTAAFEYGRRHHWFRRE